MKKSLYLLYLSIACAVAILLSCCVYYIVSLSELDLYSRLYIHTYAQKIRFPQEDTGLSALKQLSAELPFTAFSESGTRPNKVGILFSGAQDAISSKIVEGRFFSPEDFFAGNKYAVIGKGLSSQVDMVDGQPWIDVNGVAFSVIGILDTGTDSPVDQCIYYNLDAMPSPDMLYIDGSNPKQVEQSLSVLRQSTPIQEIDAPKSGVFHFMDLASTETILLFFAVSAVVTFHYYSPRLFALVCGDLACVRCLLGHSLQKVSSQIMLHRFVLFSAISVLVCLLSRFIIVPWFHFGSIPFPMAQTFLLLELLFVLPSAVYTKIYFLNQIKRRLCCV